MLNKGSFSAKNKCYLTNDDKRIIEQHLSLCIPDFLDDYQINYWNLGDCDEEIFMHLTSLLDGKVIVYGKSPWVNGKSVIYDGRLKKELQKIIKSNVSNEVTNYCKSLLKVFPIIEKYAIKEEND